MKNLLDFLLTSMVCLSCVAVNSAAGPEELAGRPASSSWRFPQIFGRSTGGQRLPRKRDGFEILEETLAYSGWRTIVQRKVKMRNGKVVDFDVRVRCSIQSTL